MVRGLHLNYIKEHISKCIENDAVWDMRVIPHYIPIEYYDFCWTL
jgi:hypothetical protein